MLPPSQITYWLQLAKVSLVLKYNAKMFNFGVLFEATFAKCQLQNNLH
jgi:hypothetical protein